MPAASQILDLDPETARTLIVTRRLLLRPADVDDIPGLVRLINDPLIALSTSRIPYPYAPIEGWRYLRAVGADRSGPGISAGFLMTLRTNPRLIVGGAGFDWQPGFAPEIGYWVGAAHRRRGFAGEATRALLARIFIHSSSTQIEAWCRVQNIASQRVLKRAGFVRIGAGLRFSRSLGRYVRAIEFVLSRADWLRRAGRDASQAHFGRTESAFALK